jgi:hypothetical protein
LEVATERTQATVQTLLEHLDQLEQMEREGSAELREVLSVFTWGDEILAIQTPFNCSTSTSFQLPAAARNAAWFTFVFARFFLFRPVVSIGTSSAT